MRITGGLFIVAFVLLSAVPSAHAQTRRRERPFRAWFGNGFGTSEQLLAFTSSTVGAYDGNVGSDGSITAPSQVPTRASWLAQTSLALSYTLARKRFEFSVQGATGATYYSLLQQALLGGRSMTLGANYQLRRHTSVTGSFNVAFMPFYSLLYTGSYDLPAEDQVPPVLVDLTSTLVKQNQLAFASQAALTHQLLRRLSFSTNFSTSQSTSATHERDFVSLSGSAVLSYQLMKDIAVKVGYSAAEVEYSDTGGSVRNRSQNYEIGLDANKALSVSSRRTTLSFRTGFSSISDGHRGRHYLTGQLTLHREIGRAWSADVGYVRGVGFLATFRTPTFTDGAFATFGGPLNEKLSFASTLGLSFGRVGFGDDDNALASISGTMSLTARLTRTLGLGVVYSAYRQHIQRGVDLPSGLPRQFDRQNVQAFLTLWVPIFHSAKRPDAPR